MAVSEIFLLRHGETHWNAARRMQGRLDSPLTEAGKLQAVTNGEVLRKLGGVNLLIASPLGRALETAYLLNSFVKAELQQEETLVERDCGQWSGLSLEEIEGRHPQEWAARKADPYHHRPPGGENLPDIAERIADFLARLKALDVPRVAVVTHGVVSRAILQDLLDLPDQTTNRVRHPNELFYHLSAEDDGFAVQHYLAGAGPATGLLLAKADE